MDCIEASINNSAFLILYGSEYLRMSLWSLNTVGEWSKRKVWWFHREHLIQSDFA